MALRRRFRPQSERHLALPEFCMRSVVFANEMANSNQLNIAEAPGSDGTAQN
jgi:hypothetical protein